jgi:hypothetical protein
MKLAIEPMMLTASFNRTRTKTILYNLAGKIQNRLGSKPVKTNQNVVEKLILKRSADERPG